MNENVYIYMKVYEKQIGKNKYDEKKTKNPPAFQHLPSPKHITKNINIHHIYILMGYFNLNTHDHHLNHY
jgi:hypothetical protein